MEPLCRYTLYTVQTHRLSLENALIFVISPEKYFCTLVEINYIFTYFFTYLLKYLFVGIKLSLHSNITVCIRMFMYIFIRKMIFFHSRICDSFLTSFSFAYYCRLNNFIWYFLIHTLFFMKKMWNVIYFYCNKNTDFLFN